MSRSLGEPAVQQVTGRQPSGSGDTGECDRRCYGGGLVSTNGGNVTVTLRLISTDGAGVVGPGGSSYTTMQRRHWAADGMYR